MFVHYSLGEQLKSELEHDYLCPGRRPVQITAPLPVCGFLLKLSLMMGEGGNPNTYFLPHRCSAVKTFFFNTA